MDKTLKLNKMQIRNKVFREAVGYFRAKPDVFIDTLIVKLNVYQKLMVRAFFKYKYVMFVMTRGLGKSFIGITCIVAYCILYPNTRAGIIAPSFRQGKKLIQEKYKDELCNKFSPFLQQEEDDFTCNTQVARVTWFNKSSMEAFPIGLGSGQEAASKIRGARLNIAYVDEAAYVPENIVKEVIIPMLIVEPDYVVGEERVEGQRSNKLIMTSTATYRVNYLYKMFCEWTRFMVEPENKDYFTLTLPWQIGVRVGLHKQDFIEQQRKTMNSDKFDMEYNGIFPRIMDGTWVSYMDIQKCSDLKHIETSGVKGFDYIMSIDVARIQGGDNSIINVFKLHWFSDHVEADLVYQKSLNGMAFFEQAVVVREILKKFPQTIRIFVDTNGLGVGLYDELAKDYYDESTESWFPPLIDGRDEEQVKAIPNASPIIYGIKQTPEINHKMGMAIKTYTQKKWLHLYSSATDENRKIDLSKEEEQLLLEAEETRYEVLNIKSKTDNGLYVKFYSTSKRKDRWSALGFGLYGAEKIFEERNKKDNSMDFFVGVSRRK